MTEPSVLPWHLPIWEKMQEMRNKLPHAILFYGLAGIGKQRFAKAFIESLLCENLQEKGFACGHCSSCVWLKEQFQHPDFRAVIPTALAPEIPTLDEDGEKTSKSKTKSKKISIDQVRALDDFVNLSAHRGGYRIIYIWPAEDLQMASSNALLKMLEEPSPQTVFILVTNHIKAIMPTILSRCTKIAMPMPRFDEALTWLEKEGVQDAKTWLAEQGGAPLLALEEAMQDNRKSLDTFLQALSNPTSKVALSAANSLRTVSARQIISWLQRWLYDLLALKMTSSQRYFYRYQDTLEKLILKVNLDELLRLIRKTNQRNRVADHPLAPQLLIEEILLDYQRIFN